MEMCVTLCEKGWTTTPAKAENLQTNLDLKHKLQTRLNHHHILQHRLQKHNLQEHNLQ